jgi:hypothetical protein
MVTTRAKSAAILSRTRTTAARLGSRFPFKIVLKGPRPDFGHKLLPSQPPRKSARIKTKRNSALSKARGTSLTTIPDAVGTLDIDKPGTQIFNTGELIGEIIFYVDWLSLMALAKTTSTVRGCVGVEIRQRIRGLVKAFIPSEETTKLIDELHAVDGVIVGSVARRLLCINMEWWKNGIKSLGHSKFHPFDYSFDLNIVVPLGKFDAIHEYLSSIGFGDWKYPDPALHFDGVLKQLQSGSRYHKEIDRVCLASTLP